MEALAKTNYEKLSAINVNEKTEKKGRFTYLSWAWAADILLRQDPLATWDFPEALTLPDKTMIVFCRVTAFDKTMLCQLPVMDNKNAAITNPNAFHVNTAMQRCLAKCIALHGLGIYIYAGEDIPQDDTPKKPVGEPKQFATYKKAMAAAKNGEQVKDIAKSYNAEVTQKLWSEKDIEEAGRIYQARVEDFTAE